MYTDYAALISRKNPDPAGFVERDCSKHFFQSGAEPGWLWRVRGRCRPASKPLELRRFGWVSFTVPTNGLGRG